MKSLLRKIIFLFCRKRIDESRIDSMRITLHKDDLRCFSLSTNTIVSFEYDGQLYYFRECPRVLKFRDYCAEAVDAFFDNLHRVGISEEHFKQEIPITVHFSDALIGQFRNDIDRRMREDRFFATMKNMDITAQQQGFSIWDNQQYDKAFVERLGLVGIADELLEIAVFFLWYMRSAALSFKTLRIVRGKRYSYFNAAKSIASAIVAQQLGLETLVSDARFCVLKTNDGKEMFGVISTAASGSRMVDTPMAPNGALQRELAALHVLDVITHQPDHGPNNYNVAVDGDQCRVCAFDNDNPYTFFPFFSARQSLVGCRPLVDGDGMIALPFLDKETAGSLQRVDVRRMKKRLKPYLNGLQSAALCYRLKKVNQAIDKTKQHRGLLLASKAFNEDTVRVELDGDGVTYLSKAVKYTGGE